MHRFELVTHPFKIEPLLKQHNINIESRVSFGPIGMERYIVAADDISPLKQIQARPYCFVLDTPVLSRYSVDDLLGMLSLLLRMCLGSAPDSFEVQKFAMPATTNIYPTFAESYLYVCAEERNFIEQFYGDVHALLGLIAVTHDPLCWINMKIPDAVEWMGSCIVDPRDVDVNDPKIFDTLRYMELARRRGFTALATNTTDYNPSRVVTEMRNGVVVFGYDREQDMLRVKKGKREENTVTDAMIVIDGRAVDRDPLHPYDIYMEGEDDVDVFVSSRERYRDIY